MKVITKFGRLTAATIASLAPPIAVAHSGHGADPALHSLLHSEHILILAAAATIAFAVYALRDK